MIDVKRATEIATMHLANQISEELYRDPDPLNTEWSIAVRTVMKHQRKTRRRFLKLWLDELQAGRFKGGFGGMAAALEASTTFGGGDKIEMPIQHLVFKGVPIIADPNYVPPEPIILECKRIDLK